MWIVTRESPFAMILLIGLRSDSYEIIVGSETSRRRGP